MRKLVSVNVGLPREIEWNGRRVRTGIFKEPVAEAVRLAPLNLEGDRQADLSVHGGPTKAVYAYPAEHYDFWRAELPGMRLPWGMFGENLTTQGLIEDSVHIGDRLRVGTAELVVTEPRLPCYKLGIRFGREEIIERFLRSGRTGFYLGVHREGALRAGDPIEVLEREEDGISVADVTRLYTRDKGNLALLRRAVTIRALPEGWRRHFEQELAKREGTHPTERSD